MCYLFPHERHDSDPSEDVLTGQPLPRHAVRKRLRSVCSRLTQVSHEQRHVRSETHAKHIKRAARIISHCYTVYLSPFLTGKGIKDGIHKGNIEERCRCLATALYLNSFSLFPFRSRTSQWELKASWGGMPQRMMAFRKAFLWRALKPNTWDGIETWLQSKDRYNHGVRKHKPSRNKKTTFWLIIFIYVCVKRWK